MKVVLALAPVWDSVTPHLAMAFLKGSLQQAGYDCTCLDFSVQFRPIMVSVLGDLVAEEYIAQHPKLYRSWAKQICEQKPDIIGFSLLGSNIANSALIAKTLRELMPDVMIISGGPSLTRENMDCIRDAFTFSDYVIEGEGEKALVDFVRCMEKKGDPSKLKQVWIKDEKGGLSYTGHTDLQNIDTIPYPDFSDFDRRAYLWPDTLPMLFSRGCILNCNYCENKWNHLTQRSRTGRNVFEELKHHAGKYNLKEYLFNDDSLISSKTMRQLDEYCDLVIAEGLVMPWSVYGTRVERLITQPFLHKLRMSGMKGVSLGVESFSSRVQKEMGKSSRYDDADRMCKMFANEGISTESWIIYGYPTETDADFDETLQWFINNPNVLSHVTANAFGPNAKYVHDKPGMITYENNLKGGWTAAESTLEKRKQRFLALIEVMESIRKMRKGDFTFYFGDPLYVKYFTSWTKRDKEFLLDRWERLESPDTYQAKNLSLFSKVYQVLGINHSGNTKIEGPPYGDLPEDIAQVENIEPEKIDLEIGDLDGMKDELYSKIETYLSGLDSLSVEQKSEKLGHYIELIENVKIYLTDNITEEIFFAITIDNNNIPVMLDDLDTHAPEYLALRVLDATAGYNIPVLN